MNQQDLFLKISIDAYYQLKGKSFRQEAVKKDNDSFNEYYIDGKKVDPEIRLYSESDNDLIEDSFSLGVEVLTREKLWEEDYDFKIMDEIITKYSSSRE